MPPPLHNLVAVVVKGHSTAADPASPNIFNTFFYARSATTLPATKPSFMTAWLSAVNAVIYPLMSVNYVQDYVQVRFQDDALDAWYAVTSGLTNGAVTGDIVPSLMNVSVRLETGIRGKSYRGSKHFGPIAKSQTLLDQLNSSAVTAWTTAIACLIANVTDGLGNVWAPVCLSRQPPYQMKVNPTSASWNTYTTAVLNVDLGRQKKRGQRA